VAAGREVVQVPPSDLVRAHRGILPVGRPAAGTTKR
jgi:hypothetical protein